MIFETSLLEFYNINIYKFNSFQQKSILLKINEGLVKIEELRLYNINFINNYIYNCSYNNYNRDLFIFETNLYFKKLKFMYCDYLINSQIIESNFSAGEASPSKNNLSYIKEEFKPDSFSKNYRKKLNNSMQIGGFITPFEDFDVK